MFGSVNMKGKSVEEAVSSALQVLGKTREEVDVRVISEGESGFLGMVGGKEAEVEVTPKSAAGEQARIIVQEILDKMGFITLVSITKEDAETVELEIKGEDMGRIIGKEGASLDALQYITSIVLSKRREARVRVIIDAEGYRERRRLKVIEDADKYAKDVESSGKEKSIAFLSSADRRLIHMHIQEKYPNLSSASRGEGQGRQLVISPNKPDKA
jgi:spoIIIJ-associated protein